MILPHCYPKDGDTETKRRAVELAEEEDFGTSTQGQVNLRNCTKIRKYRNTKVRKYKNTEKKRQAVELAEEEDFGT